MKNMYFISCFCVCLLVSSTSAKEETLLSGLQALDEAMEITDSFKERSKYVIEDLGRGGGVSETEIAFAKSYIEWTKFNEYLTKAYSETFDESDEKELQLALGNKDTRYVVLSIFDELRNGSDTGLQMRFDTLRAAYPKEAELAANFMRSKTLKKVGLFMDRVSKESPDIAVSVMKAAIDRRRAELRARGLIK